MAGTLAILTCQNDWRVLIDFVSCFRSTSGFYVFVCRGNLLFFSCLAFKKLHHLPSIPKFYYRTKWFAFVHVSVCMPHRLILMLPVPSWIQSRHVSLANLIYFLYVCHLSLLWLFNHVCLCFQCVNIVCKLLNWISCFLSKLWALDASFNTVHFPSHIPVRTAYVLCSIFVSALWTEEKCDTMLCRKVLETHFDNEDTTSHLVPCSPLPALVAFETK